MNSLEEVEAELYRVLQGALDKLWEEEPIGYNKDNNGYHMSKGLIVDKETWKQYNKALKTRPKLDPYEFMVELIKKKVENEQPR